MGFQFTPLVRGATGQVAENNSKPPFQFTPLVRGATTRQGQGARRDRVSIHAPRARGDRPRAPPASPVRFQFTPLVRGATSDALGTYLGRAFQFTPLVRGATRDTARLVIGFVSIHAPRARGDSSTTDGRRCRLFQFTPLVRGATACAPLRCGWRCFNSRPSCEGRHRKPRPFPRPSFQFTPLVRGATYDYVARKKSWRFNSRPSCEGRPLVARNDDATSGVSIHAPRARGDLPPSIPPPAPAFQFTPLVRGATANIEEPTKEGFNSRPSCEGRPFHRFEDLPYLVSIHAPRARGDLSSLIQRLTSPFQFTPLVRGATRL